MNNSILENIILANLNFLITEYNFVVNKKETHWLGGIEVEYIKDNYLLNFIYDSREKCFNCRLYSSREVNKTHLYLVGELRKFCSTIPSPSISLDNNSDVLNFWQSFSECLNKNLLKIIKKFEIGDYFGG